MTGHGHRPHGHSHYPVGARNRYGEDMTPFDGILIATAILAAAGATAAFHDLL